MLGWYDWACGQRFEGGQWVTVDAPLDRLPLFVREGALVPTTNADDDRARTEESSRALRWFPGPDGQGTAWLFEDDGLQAAGTPDRQVVHRFTGDADASSLTLQLESEGSWPLPYPQIRVILPAGERRTLQCMPPPGGVSLVR